MHTILFYYFCLCDSWIYKQYALVTLCFENDQFQNSSSYILSTKCYLIILNSHKYEIIKIDGPKQSNENNFVYPLCNLNCSVVVVQRSLISDRWKCSVDDFFVWTFFFSVAHGPWEQIMRIDYNFQRFHHRKCIDGGIGSTVHSSADLLDGKQQRWATSAKSHDHGNVSIMILILTFITDILKIPSDLSNSSRMYLNYFI